MSKKQNSDYRYDRTLSADFEDLLRPGGELDFILRPESAPGIQDSYALDVQLRENNKVMLYHGGTRVLVVRHAPRKRGLRLSFSDTNKFYKDLPVYRRLNEAAEDGKIPPFRDAYRRYLRDAVKAIDANQPRWYRKEGYWQNRLAHELGVRSGSNPRSLLLIDREAVIGHASSKKKVKFYDGIVARHVKRRKNMKSESPKEFGNPTKDKGGFGDECDFLALDESGNLICLELKHGSNYSGIYWGLLQTNAYYEAFAEVFEKIKPSVFELVEQKKRLGLLSPKAADRFTNRGIKNVIGMLGVAEPELNHHYVWDRLNTVAEAFPEVEHPVALFDGKGRPTIYKKPSAIPAR